MKKYFTNYETAIEFSVGKMVLCNTIETADERLYENCVTGNLYDEETEEYRDIFQWYLTNKDAYEVERASENFPDLIFFYSELLDLYVLGVPHWGTPWRSVDIECSEYIAELFNYDDRIEVVEYDDGDDDEE